jgi:toxin YhaV
VEALAKRQPESYRNHPKAKLLKRVMDLVLVEIPRDPNAAEFQLDNTLGPAYRHWRRAKFLGLCVGQ